MYNIGDKVVCRLYNTPERKFYGDYFVGEIVEIDLRKSKPYLVNSEEKYFPIWMQRKELKKKANST